MKKTPFALAAIAALALPAGAHAGKPDKPGKSHEAQAAKTTKAPKTKRVGFTAAGTGLTGLAFTDGASSAFTLDLTRANKHAREALKLTAEQIAAATATEFAAESNGFRLKFGDGVVDRADDDNTTVGLEDVLPTDSVKLIGKVERTRTRAPKSTRFTYGAIDLRKVVISRG